MTPTMPTPTTLIPHQSLKARFPGSSLAARELGVTRGHLWQVLSGRRASLPLLTRWQAWLALHPEFARLQPPSSTSPLITAH
jgi:hypothetical protein